MANIGISASSSTSDDKAHRPRLKINISGKNQPLVSSNSHRVNLSPNVPKINVEDVTLTDVEQSSDEMNDELLQGDEGLPPEILEIEGSGYEETIDASCKTGLFKSKNKVAVYSLPNSESHLKPKQNKVCELTDTEELDGSDFEAFEPRDFVVDPDFLLKYHVGKEVIAITDEMKGRPVPSPAVTPEPCKTGLRRRKQAKYLKDQYIKQGGSTKTNKPPPFLAPDFRAELSSTLTDTELLLSNSESEHDECRNKIAQKKTSYLTFDGWVTDVEDLAVSSGDEYLSNMNRIKTSNSINDFFYLGESGSDDEFDMSFQKRARSFPHKKLSPKMNSLNQYYPIGTSFDGQQIVKNKRTNVSSRTVGKKPMEAPCFIEGKELKSRKQFSEGYIQVANNSKLMKNENKNKQFLEYCNAAVKQSYVKQIPKMKNSKIPFFCTEEGNSTEIESFGSESETESTNSRTRKLSPSTFSKLNPRLKQFSLMKNTQSQPRSNHNIQAALSGKSSPALSLPENSVIRLNENLKESKSLQVGSSFVDPLTDTEEILLTGGGTQKDVKVKKKSMKTLSIIKNDRAVTDTEEIELSDHEKPRRYLCASIPKDNVVTDIEDFSVDDSDEELNVYSSPHIATPEHVQYVRSSTMTTDKEGINPYFVSETENNFFSDQDIPIIRTISPSPTYQPTDSEDMVASADEDAFSRNETPNVDTKAYEDHYSVVHMKNTRKFKFEGEETLHIKNPTDTQDPLTDVEDITCTLDENNFSGPCRSIVSPFFGNNSNENSYRKFKKGQQGEHGSQSLAEASRKRAPNKKYDTSHQESMGEPFQEAEKDKQRDFSSKDKGFQGETGPSRGMYN